MLAFGGSEVFCIGEKAASAIRESICADAKQIDIGHGLIWNNGFGCDSELSILTAVATIGDQIVSALCEDDELVGLCRERLFELERTLPN